MSHPVRWQSSPCLLLPVFAMLLALLAACNSDSDDPQVRVEAEILEAGAPAAVEVVRVGPGQDGVVSHGVRVTWNGDEPVRLDDARFTHQIGTPTGERVTLTFGRGCFAGWDEVAGELSGVCQGDLQSIDVEPGEAHEYPVSLLHRAGPYTLASGTYVTEEPIEYWPAGSNMRPEPSLGRFTIRITYTVE